MKKFCLAMLALGMTLTAAADYYVVGAGVNGSEAWNNPGASQKMTEKGNGVYEWTGTSLKSNFKINEGNWNGTIIGSNNSKLKVGEAYSYNTGNQTTNIEFDGVGEVENPTVTLDTAAGTILVKGAGQAEQFTGLDIYLAGSFNNYTGGDAKYKFTENGSTGVYELKLDSFSGNFKVVTPSGWFGTRTKVVFGESYVLSDIGYDNTTFASAPTAPVTFTYTAESRTLVVTQDGGVVNPPIPENYTYEMHGQLTGNSSWESVKFTDNNGVWSWTGNIVPGEFGIKKCENGNQVEWIGGGANITAEGTYDFTGNGNSKSTLEGTYTIAYEPATGKLTFTKYSGVIEDKIGYSIRGNMVTGEWNDYEMTENNGLWSAKLTVIAGEFGIKKTNNGAQEAWYAAPTADVAKIEATGDFTCGDTGTTNFNNTLEGEYTFTFNPETMVLTVSGGSVVTPPIPDDNYTYAMHGQLTGNSSWESINFTNDNGVWSWTGDIVPGEFGIKKCENGNQVEWIGGGVIINAEGTYDFTGNGNSKSTLEGAYTISYEPATGKLTFTKYNGVVETKVGYVIRGNFVTGEWNDYEMTEIDGEWVIKLNVIEGEFGIKKTENGVQKAWIASPDAAGANITSTGVFTCGDLGTTNFNMGVTGEYLFSFNPEAMTLSVSSAASVIEFVEVEGEAVYYNLQGVKVVNPEHGIFVKVVNGKAIKVVK